MLVVESSKGVQYSQKNKENLNFLTALKLLEILCRLGFEKSYMLSKTGLRGVRLLYKNRTERSYALIYTDNMTDTLIGSIKDGSKTI